MMEPEHKGAAVSVQNLGGGLANFGGPVLAALILPFWGIGGVVVVYGVALLLRGGPHAVHSRGPAEGRIGGCTGDTLREQGIETR